MIKHNLIDQVSRLKTNSDDPGGLGIEGLRLLVHLEKQSNPDFNCYVLTRENLPKLLATLQNAPDVPTNGSKNIELIVKSGIHYSTIHLELSKDPEKCRAIILDAVASKSIGKIHEILKDSMDESTQRSYFHNVYTIVSPGYQGIQSDQGSCSIFSLDHARAISKNPLDELITNGNPANKAGGYDIPWENLPPEFVKNAQSVRRFLKNYKEQREGGDLKA